MALGASQTVDPIRLGMVGGGDGAFIGAVHRMAARLDDRYRLVAAALSSDADRARLSGDKLRLATDRIYSDYRDMASRESRRDDGIEAVAIVTPNDLHARVAKEFLAAGIHVICDKPLTTSMEEANELKAARLASGRHLFATYNYSFHPLAKRARDIVLSGELGDVRVVQVEYAQDWLTRAIETEGQKQASWRTDPKRAGAGAIGDIGTHAFQLAEFVTGSSVVELLAELSSIVPNRQVDDNAQIMLRFANSARGALWASQVAPGNDNNLAIRVYGTKGGLEWRQEDCNRLWWTPIEEPKRLISRGGPLSSSAGATTRLPPGHPEGYIEAFANTYSEIADCIRGGGDPAFSDRNFNDAMRGVKFVSSAIASSTTGTWRAIE